MEKFNCGPFSFHFFCKTLLLNKNIIHEIDITKPVKSTAWLLSSATISEFLEFLVFPVNGFLAYHNSF